VDSGSWVVGARGKWENMGRSRCHWLAVHWSGELWARACISQGGTDRLDGQATGRCNSNPRSRPKCNREHFRPWGLVSGRNFSRAIRVVGVAACIEAVSDNGVE
jgi:hypothetical protein